MNDKGLSREKKTKKNGKINLKKKLNTDVQESTVRTSSSIQIIVFSDFKPLDFGSHHNILLRQLSSVPACE